MSSQRNAFTLIEVMVAVMIVSVVIGAMWKIRGDATQKLHTLNEMTQTLPYSSFLIEESKRYGFEKSNISLDALSEGFDFSSDLRRELKGVKLAMSYHTQEVIDTNESVVLEIGTTTMEMEGMRVEFARVRLQ
jgi:prepilin-type N-terminal cleavage/methylation domain-containing protein